MKFGSIASGSSGNCLYARGTQARILIDAGISCKRICEGLKNFEESPSDIDGILITHEHIDHVSGLGVLSRKFHIPIYGTEKTLRHISTMANLGKIDKDLFIPIEKSHAFSIGDLTIEPFSISHDAVDPVSYNIHEGNHKIGMVTDLGYFDDRIVNFLKDSQLLYLEANHDIHMLQAGPYPYYLKRRILGDQGHLCNEKTAELASKLSHDQLKTVILGHLSKENNYPDLALATVKNELDPSIDLVVAPRDHTSNLYDINF